MAKLVELITHLQDGSQTKYVVAENASNSGKQLIIQANKNIKTYELKELTSKYAPNKILTKRAGKDLVIHLGVDGDPTSLTEAPDIILKDYYSDNFGQLIGLAEDGEYYPYVPQEGEVALITPNMADGAFSYQALGVADSISPLAPLPNAITSSVATTGMGTIALGALGVGAVAAAAGGGGGGGSTPDTTPPTTTITDDSTGSTTVFDIGETVTSGGNIGSSYDPAGQIVATLSSSETVSYTLTNANDTPSIEFEIKTVGGTTGIYVKSGVTLDYETTSSYNLKLTSTDVAGNITTQSFTISVTNYSGSYSGTAGNDTITGTSEEDNIYGDAGNDTINGGAGADMLDGGAGVDYLNYNTDTAGVTVDLSTNTVSGGEAQGDTISNFENVYGGAGADIITGDGNNNELYGNAGNDFIYGGDGNDFIYGGDDNDFITGSAGADTLDGGVGIDGIYYIADTAGVTVDLSNNTVSGGEAQGDTISNFENVYGGSGNDTITGDGNNNMLYGYAGDDSIDGGAGHDIINGGDGNDTITGGAGVDYFGFYTALDATTNVDTILDFNHTDDTIYLYNAIFTALSTTGTLNAANFVANATGTAADIDDYIVYNTSNGELYYDEDGNGAIAAVLFATLSTTPTIDNTDFYVY